MDTVLQRYTAFLKTVEFESISKAAEALQCSKYVLSRMIKSLEKEYGVTLLKQSSKRVCLTSEGKILLPDIMKICDTARNSLEKAASIKAEKNGMLRLGATANIAAYWLPAVIHKFHIDYPDINFELLTGDGKTITDWISEGRVDCGILPQTENCHLDSYHLFRERFSAVLPADHPFADKERLTVEDFDGVPFILPEKDGDAAVFCYLAQNNVAPDIRLMTWNHYTAMHMVENGIGISIISDEALKSACANITAKPVEPPLCRDIVFALKNTGSASPLVRRFTEYLVQGE